MTIPPDEALDEAVEAQARDYRRRAWLCVFLAGLYPLAIAVGLLISVLVT